MNQEKQAAILRLADDVRQVQAIPTFVPNSPPRTIYEVCQDKLFPKVDALVEPGNLTFA